MIEQILQNCPQNIEIFDSFIVTSNKLEKYKAVMCSVSGGSDSDILIDILTRLGYSEKITWVWFDTGLEYQATKDHLDSLEKKYKIEIKRVKAVKPIPTCCRKYGQPFVSKLVSEMISRLQRHNFTWEDGSFEELSQRFPRCKRALKWWCNDYDEGSKFNISYNRLLKEFMIQNPPTFQISNKCCDYAKKKVAKLEKSKGLYDLSITGVRKSEGGIRSSVYSNCFSDNSDKDEIDEYRLIFWYKDQTKQLYDDFYGVQHSKCYSQYGLKRTGCAGCPYGRDFEKELEIISKYEPKLYKAVNKIFKDTYEYTRQYKDFVKTVKQGGLK